MTDDPRNPAERLVARDIEDQLGGRLSQRTLGFERSVDSYLRAGIRPRWMERLIEIETHTRRARRTLGRLHRELRESDPDGFAARWRDIAASWDFDAVNELIRTHNQWYPIERDLPVNPRTGEFVLVTGRSYRREELGEAWILAEFPV